ncbi:AGAP007030-PA-like protein [Anopheles sinensis]|uniref:AGAP007030-PA-like protein n=1 Tax=Anopheles sinensis TaxID=74873 RepID=A0A084W3B9_ANOSI|nr:AGAP007030-PA-like protein [Anopheles sinensis]
MTALGNEYELPSTIAVTDHLEHSIAHHTWNYECRIRNWNPREEGTFVLTHIPDNYTEVKLTNLLLSSVNSALVEDHVLAGVRLMVLTIVKSAIRSFKVKDNSRLTFLGLEYTYLNTLNFGVNSTIQVLKVDSSRLEQMPRSIATLSELVRLTITKSIIRAVNLDFMGGLKKLQFLDLSKNKINALYYRAQPELYPVLRDVYLRGNKLQSINTDLFNSMIALHTLDLSHNQISVVSGSLKSSNLSFLDLSFNRIKKLDCCQWVIPNIHNFIISKNQLLKLPMCIESVFGNITGFNVHHNQLHLDEMWKFAGMRYLTALKLSHNNLRHVTLNADTLPPNLLFLDMSHNKVQQLDLKYIPNERFLSGVAQGCKPFRLCFCKSLATN